MAEAIHTIKGRALISGYPCDLLEKPYGDRLVALIPKKKDVGAGPKADAVECVWMNW